MFDSYIFHLLDLLLGLNFKILLVAMILLILDIVLICLLLKITGVLIKKHSRKLYLKENNNSVKIEDEKKQYFTVGFFHPFCNSGGGGERVLWSCIKALQDTFPNCVCVVYTGDREAKEQDLIQKAYDRFNIALDKNRTKFVYLRFRFLVLDKYYPIFTLLGQSLGSLLLGIEAFLKFIPDIYFETTGYAFTYPLFYYFGNIPVCCYTHYPTISTDMLERVVQQRTLYNNRAMITRSPFLTKLKLIYYQLFAKLYSFCGRCSTCIMTNSSWTQGHIEKLWSMTYKTKIVYPPCDTSKFETVFSDNKHDQNFFISSVGQFRPEKNHQLQIKAFAKFLEKVKQNNQNTDKIVLKLIGSCRNEEDEQRVKELKDLAKDLNVYDKIEFNLNFSFDILLDQLAQSAVGIHSMIDEHFGIGIVECMSAGTVMIAHNSAGPKMDIVVPYKGEKTGFLAETEEEYCDNLYLIFNMSTKKRNSIRQAAREHVRKFSQEEFNSNFLESFINLCFKNYFSIKKNE